jgi:hypothetical protein
MTYDESYIVLIKEKNTRSLFSGHMAKSGHLSLPAHMKMVYVQVMKL